MPDGEDVTGDALNGVALPPVRRPGRPAGQKKTGGRKPGQTNLITRDTRAYIEKRGRPIQLLAQVAAGNKIRLGPKQYGWPTMEQRLYAASLLIRKLVPDAKAPDGPAAPETSIHDLASRNGSHPDIELARRIAHAFTRGEKAMDEQAAAADPYQSRGVAPPDPEPAADTVVNRQYADTAPEPAPEPEPAPRPYRYIPGLRGPSAFVE